MRFYWNERTVGDDVRFLSARYRSGGPWTTTRIVHDLVARYGVAFCWKGNWRFFGLLLLENKRTTREVDADVPNETNGGLNRAGTKKDNACAHDANQSPGNIPLVRSMTFGNPKPADRSKDIDPAIGRIGAAGRLALDKGQQVSKRSERDHPGNKPQNRLVQAEPCPKSKAPDDLRNCGSNVGSDCRHLENNPSCESASQATWIQEDRQLHQSSDAATDTGGAASGGDHGR